MKALRLKQVCTGLLMVFGAFSYAFAHPADTIRRVSKSSINTIVIDPGHGGKDGGAHGKYYTEAQLALAISLKLREVMKREMPDVNILMTRTSDVLPGNQQDINAALRWRANFANENQGDLFISVHLNAAGANQKYGKRVVGERQETYYTYTGKGKSRKKVKKTRTVPVYERYKLPATVYGTQTYILASNGYNGKVNVVSKMEDDDEAGEHMGGERDSLSAEMLAIDPIEAKIRAAQYTKLYFGKSLSLAEIVEDEFNQLGRKSWGVQQRDWKGIWVLQATQMPCILIESGFIDHPDEEAYLGSPEGQQEMAEAIVRAVRRYRAALDENVRSVTNSNIGNDAAAGSQRR